MRCLRKRDHLCEREKSQISNRHFLLYHYHYQHQQGDPGYNQTAKMMIESALCIALEENKLPKRYGVLTPAAAFGHVLIERLEKNTMMHFTLHPPAHPTKPTFGSQKKEL